MGHQVYILRVMQVVMVMINANNEKLIRELQGKSNRTGHYVCALALILS